MEKLYSPMYDLDMLGKNGKYIYHVLRRRVDPIFPNKGYLIENKKLWLKSKKIAVSIIKEFKLNGLYDCDLSLDKNNDLAILEVNPRMSGSVAVCKKANIPILEYLIESLKNKHFKKINKIPKSSKKIYYKY